jgi:hypothetical protein
MMVGCVSIVEQQQKRTAADVHVATCMQQHLAAVLIKMILQHVMAYAACSWELVVWATDMHGCWVVLLEVMLLPSTSSCNLLALQAASWLGMTMRMLQM